MTDKLRKVSAAAALALTAGAAVLAFAAPAQAAPEPVCGTWQLRGATGQYPDVTFGEAPTGAEVLDGSTVALVKPEGVAPGVEFAAFDLDVAVAAGTVVTVHYATSGGDPEVDDVTAAGAVRLFAYAEQDADTLNDAPLAFDAAETDGEGTLSIELPAGTLGTLGLVYDASNPTAHLVTFTDLTVGDRPVDFEGCPQESPSPSVTPSATASPSAATSSPSASRTPAAGLPVTGSPVNGILAVGGGLLFAGAIVLAAVARRRRFEA